jgi:uncharacterized protein YndB with AHSA1/START domain
MQVSAPVEKTVEVDCPAAEAFRFFTAAFGRWWPLATHSCIAYSSGHRDQPATVTFATHEGGQIVEHGRNGERFEWGTVLVWDPPSRVAFTWHPGRPAASAQHVEVTFTPSPSGTRVSLTHTGWERLGDEAEAARTSYDQGWEKVFVEAFARFVANEVRAS